MTDNSQNIRDVSKNERDVTHFIGFGENLVLSYIVNPITKYKIINIRNKNWDK